MARYSRNGKQRRKPSKRFVVISVVVVAAALLAGGAYVLLGEDDTAETAQQREIDTAQQTDTPVDTVETDPDRIRLLLTGDIIGHDSLNENASSASGYDYLQFMSDFQNVFQQSDIVFCNQATLVGGDSFAITGYPSFNAPAELVRDMAGVGCNVINTASNHSADKTQGHIDANVQFWAEQDVLAVAGQNSTANQSPEIPTFMVKDTTFAFLAYTTYSNVAPPNSYGVNVYSQERAANDVARAKELGADYIITSMRWGTEYANSANAQQTREAQYLADLGVDVILGHGPHVLQPVDRLTGQNGNETVVWHSLGNFLQTQLEPETLFNVVGVIDIDLEGGGLQLGYEPIYMHYDWTAEDRANQNLLARTNLQLVWLDDAAELFASSPLSSETSIDAQRSRIDEVLNRNTTVESVSISR